MNLVDKLTLEEQQHFLNTLFGFNFINVNEDDNDPHFVLYDEEGYEFYGSSENCQFDFSTLSGIFSYTAHVSNQRGYSSCQYAIKKILGL